MKKRKELTIVLLIIGAILMLSSIISIYNTYANTKGYEETEAICIEEDENRR